MTDSARHRSPPGAFRWPGRPVAAVPEPARCALVPSRGISSAFKGLTGALLVAIALVCGQPAKGSDGSDLVEASSSGDLAKVNELLADGVDPNFDNGRPLWVAVSWGHDAVIDALLEAGADPDLHRDVYWWEPPLFVATRRGDDTTVEKLLRHDADPNISHTNEETVTALHWAALYGTGVEETATKDGVGVAAYLAIIDRLVRAGASVDALSSFGNTPLSFVGNRLSYGGSEPKSLFSAASAAIFEALFDYGADPNRPIRRRPGSDDSPLFSTVIWYFGQYFGSIADPESALSLVKHFLAAGADVNATDSDGETALDQIADHYARDSGVVSEVIAAIQAAGGVRSPRWKLLDLDVHEAHTNSVVVTWRYPAGSNRLTPREGGFTTRSNHYVALEYREYGSGRAFVPGGTTGGGEADGFGRRTVPTFGVIAGLSPNTVYEIRARLQGGHGSRVVDLGEWSTARAATTAPLRIRMETSRTVDGQKTFSGYVGPLGKEVWLTGDEGTVVFDDGALASRTYVAVRARGNDGPGSIPPTVSHFSREGLTYFHFPGLHEKAEHEVRIVSGYAITRSARSAESIYPGLFGTGAPVVDVSEWVRIGPNAPPQFDGADYWHGRGILGDRGDNWGRGKVFAGHGPYDEGEEPQVSAIGTDGVLLCKGQGGDAPLVRCAVAPASDPDGDRLSYWLWRESEKFEVDSRTGEVRTKARGAAAIKRAFPESFEVPTFGFTDDRRSVSHGVGLAVDDGRGGFDRAWFSLRFLPSLSIVDASGPIPSVPGAPADLAASQSGDAVSVSWTAPGTDDGGPAIDYAIEWKSGGQDYAASREQGRHHGHCRDGRRP